MVEITGKTKIFGVIADPIDHVRAPKAFNPIFKQKGIDAVLVPLHIMPENLEAVMRGLSLMPNFGGVCVTIPHKVTLAAICDVLGPTAKMVGAVNAVRFEGGKMIGDNFDGAGFTAGLTGEGVNLTDLSVLLLGAGGAAQAIAASLSSCNIKRLGISNRNLTKAEDLVFRLQMMETTNPDINIRAIPPTMLDQCLEQADLIINATSLGLKATDALPCCLDRVKSTAIVADIIMVPERTPWLNMAEERGLKIHLGKHMLDYQLDLIAEFIGAY